MGDLFFVLLLFVAYLGSYCVMVVIASVIPYGGLRFAGKQPEYTFVFLATFFILPFVLYGIGEFLEDMEVRERDIVGTYVIDTDYFPGPDAEWQYEKYSFTIDRRQILTFTERNRDGSIRKQCRTPISYNYNYVTSDHLRLPRGCDKCHHVLSTSPTLWRHWWSFTYVFTSPHYGNMYFRKLRWWERRPI